MHRSRASAILSVPGWPKWKSWVKALEKDKNVSEDKSKKAHQDVQKLTDNMVKAIDEAGSKREKEILEIG